MNLLYATDAALESKNNKRKEKKRNYYQSPQNSKQADGRGRLVWLSLRARGGRDGRWQDQAVFRWQDGAISQVLLPAGDTIPSSSAFLKNLFPFGAQYSPLAIQLFLTGSSLYLSLKPPDSPTQDDFTGVQSF